MPPWAIGFGKVSFSYASFISRRRTRIATEKRNCSWKLRHLNPPVLFPFSMRTFVFSQIGAAPRQRLKNLSLHFHLCIHISTFYLHSQQIECQKRLIPLVNDSIESHAKSRISPAFWRAGCKMLLSLVIFRFLKGVCSVALGCWPAAAWLKTSSMVMRHGRS